MDNISSGDTLKPSGGDIDPKKLWKNSTNCLKIKETGFLSKLQKKMLLKNRQIKLPIKFQL